MLKQRLCGVAQKHKNQLKGDVSKLKYKPGLKRQVRLCQLVIRDTIGKENNMQTNRGDYANRSRTGDWERIMNRPAVLQMWFMQGQIVTL